MNDFGAYIRYLKLTNFIYQHIHLTSNLNHKNNIQRGLSGLYINNDEDDDNDDLKSEVQSNSMTRVLIPQEK